MTPEKENGFTLIGILIVVLIIASLAYGGSFFLNKNSQNTKSLQQSVNSQLDKIKINVDKANELKTNAINSTENAIDQIKNTDNRLNKAKDNMVNNVNKIKEKVTATTTQENF
jgi:type II secretory pathway pseudopilin PulG